MPVMPAFRKKKREDQKFKAVPRLPRTLSLKKKMDHKMDGVWDLLRPGVSCFSKTVWGDGQAEQGRLKAWGSFSCGQVSLPAPTSSNTNKIDDNN